MDDHQPTPTRTVVASRLEPVWERCTYYIEVPADMPLPLIDEDDPDSIDVDALIEMSVEVHVDIADSNSAMAGADPTDWRIRHDI